MGKTLAATVLIVQNIVAFIVGLHCATSVQCLKRTRTLPDGRQERRTVTKHGDVTAAGACSTDTRVISAV